MKIFRVGTALGMAILLGVASLSFAESAPVYDADAVEQQFDNSYDQGPDLPLPPPPGQEGGAYVPSQTAQSQASSSPTTPLSMDQRVRRIEQQIDNLQNNDLNTRLNALQSEVQSLRGQMEQLMHEMQQVQNQQKAMYSDFDKRLSQNVNSNSMADNQASANTMSPASTENSLASSPVPTKADHKPDMAKSVKSQSDDLDNTQAPTSLTPVANQPNVAEEQQIYQTAYNLIKAKKYEEAVNALQGMLKKYPSGQFAANAHYWLGELYGLMGKNDKALVEFNAVVKTYPRSPRVSDAQLKVGLIYASEFNWSSAKAAFKKVINRYPGTSSARLASEQLKQIRQAGH